MSLWDEVMEAELIPAEKVKPARARFTVNWLMFGEMRIAQHPAFDWPNWEPWEVVSIMRTICYWMGQDLGAQRRFTRRA